MQPTFQGKSKSPPGWQIAVHAFLGVFALLSAVDRLSDRDDSGGLLFGLLGVFVGIYFSVRAVLDVRRRWGGGAGRRREGAVAPRRAADDAVRAMTSERIGGFVEEHRLDVDTSAGRISLIKTLRGADPRLGLVDAKNLVDDWCAENRR